MNGIYLHYDSGVICVELVKKLQKKGAKFSEIGVHHFPRLYGHSQFFNFRRVSRTLIEQVKLWWNLIILKYYD